MSKVSVRKPGRNSVEQASPSQVDARMETGKTSPQLDTVLRVLASLGNSSRPEQEKVD